ncbi:pyridoxal-5'-phosphate-dependent protein subunit beta, partial [Mycobacterium paragordonae]
MAKRQSSPVQCQPAAESHRQPAGLVGNTPVLRISEPLTPADRGFWAKLEGFNPGG